MTFLVSGHQGNEIIFSISINLRSSPDRVVDDHQEKLVKLLDLFVEHVHNKFNKYAFYFFLCELLNIVITVIMVSEK